MPHYWILHPDKLELTVLRHASDGYLLVATAFPGDVLRLEPFDAVELEVTKLFGDIELPTPDEGPSNEGAF